MALRHDINTGYCGHLFIPMIWNNIMVAMPDMQKSNGSSKISTEDLRVDLNVMLWSLKYSG